MKKKMIFLFVIVILFFFTFTIYSLAMATIHVKATDNDGWAKTNYYIEKYNPSEKEYQGYIYSKVCDKGEYTFSVEPGVYNIKAYYMETGDSYYCIAIENIQIEDNQKIDKEIYFEKGFIHIKAIDNDGWANTSYGIYKYNPSTKKYREYIYNVDCEKGEYTFSAEPGVYEIRARYNEKESNQKIEISDINMVDQITRFIPIDFSSKNIKLPKVRAEGLIEIGDNDSIFELGEKVSLDFEVSSGDIEEILVEFNDKRLKKYSQPGRYHIETPLGKVGDNVLKISLKNSKIDFPAEIPLKFIVNPQDGKSGKLETVKKSKIEKEEEEKEKVILPEEDTLIYKAEKKVQLQICKCF